ncbi:MAG: hypothetical protein WDO14_00090 [Bacteroidota bacterium]
MSPEQITVYIKEIAERDGIDVYGFNTGLDYKGVSLGSSSFTALQKPVIAMVIEGGVSANDAGEMWHLLDTRFNMPVTLIPQSVFNSANINKYNVIIFPPGNFGVINDGAKEKLKTWTQNGGVIIGFETALNWLSGAGLGKFDMKKEEAAKIRRSQSLMPTSRKTTGPTKPAVRSSRPMQIFPTHCCSGTGMRRSPCSSRTISSWRKAKVLTTIL